MDWCMQHIHLAMIASEPALKLGQKSQTLTNQTQGKKQQPAKKKSAARSLDVRTAGELQRRFGKISLAADLSLVRR